MGRLVRFTGGEQGHRVHPIGDSSLAITARPSQKEAVMILKPHLPKNFLPRGEVGRAIEHIRKKLTDHITKNLPSSE
jgi:hypothetical protein